MVASRRQRCGRDTEKTGRRCQPDLTMVTFFYSPAILRFSYLINFPIPLPEIPWLGKSFAERPEAGRVGAERSRINQCSFAVQLLGAMPTVGAMPTAWRWDGS